LADLWSGSFIALGFCGGLQPRGPALQLFREIEEAVPVALRRQISGEAPCVVRPVPQVGKLLQAEIESATLRGDGCMKRGRFTEEQIIGVLREQEAGMRVAEVCRKHGVSEPTFYAWKAKFGGMSVSDAKRLKELEGENAKLKKLLAEAMLDNAVLKDITSRKW